MGPKTETHPGETPEIIWAVIFANTYLSLSQGDGDIHHLIDLGYELWPMHGKRDAVEVAKEEFAKATSR